MIQPNNFNWPGKVWICSDLHLGDTGILKYERIEFKTPEEHDKFIIKKINSTINKNDTFVCLGDLGRYWEESFKQIKQCARKVLILGNHDHDRSKYKKYFDEIYAGPLFVNRFTVLSHEPIPVSEHFLNVHGHLHCANLDDDHHLNVNMAMHDYKLFQLDDSINMAAKYPRIHADFLEEWYADKYIFSNNRKDCLIYADTLHIVPRSDIEVALTFVDILLDDDPGKKIGVINYFKENKVFKHEINLQSKSTDSKIKLAEELIKIWETNFGNDN